MISGLFPNGTGTSFVFGLIVALFYVPMLIWLARAKRKVRTRRRFFNAVLTIMADEADDEVALARIKTAYKSLCEIYPYAGSFTKSYGQLLEGFYFRMASLLPGRFKEVYQMEPDAKLRGRIASLMEKFRIQEPFASVSSKFGNLLFLTQRAIETSNVELGVSSLSQIAQEVELLEDRLRAQEKQNSLTTIVSVVGVILTIVFGIVSLIPLISPLWEQKKQQIRAPIGETSQPAEEAISEGR